MLLSNAIATGRVLMDKWDCRNYCGCAIAAGLRGAGLISDDMDENSLRWFYKAVETWPWLENSIDVPPNIVNRFYSGESTYNNKAFAYSIVSNMFGMVEKNEMTLDQLIDYVQSVEPAEEIPVDAVPKEEVEYASMT